MAKSIAMAQDIAQDMAQDIAQEKSMETAQRFLVMGILPEQVSKGTGIPLEKVLDLKKKLEP